MKVDTSTFTKGEYEHRVPSVEFGVEDRDGGTLDKTGLGFAFLQITSMYKTCLKIMSSAALKLPNSFLQLHFARLHI